MDNAEYLMERQRICGYYEAKCAKCPLGQLKQCVHPEDQEKAAVLVEKWKMDMTILETLNGWMRRLYGGGEKSG